MNKEKIKDALIAILIGAAVAFFTVLFEGLLEFLQNNGNNIVGGTASTLTYIARRHII